MDDEPAKFVSRLFALLTGQLEDCVTLALEGQSRQSLATQHERAHNLEAQVRDAQTIAQALVMLTSPASAAGAEPGPSLD